MRRDEIIENTIIIVSIIAIIASVVIAVNRVGIGNIIEATPLRYLMPSSAEGNEFCKEAKRFGLVCVESDLGKIRIIPQRKEYPVKVELTEEWWRKSLSIYYSVIPDLCTPGKDCVSDLVPEEVK